VIAAIALLIASLLATSELVFSDWAQAMFAGNGDSIAIAKAAQAASVSDIPAWWTGPWIQHEMYYRPLASMLFFIQGKLFGDNFQHYCVVSWIANALNVVLLMLLGASLARGTDRLKLAIGILTGVLFLLARHPEIFQGPDTDPAAAARVTWGIMPWWPVQTDVFSLMFGMLSLLLLDRYLVDDGRAKLIGAAGSFLAALLFKEMALAIPLMVPLLVLYRKRSAVAPVTALYLGIGLVFYIVRTLAAPEASGFEWQGIKTVNNFGLYFAHSLWRNVMSETWAPVFTSMGLVIFALVMIWRRIEWVWIIFMVPLWLLLGGQLFAGNFAQFSVIGPWLRLLPALLLWAGAALLILSRQRGASPALLAAVAFACIPVLNRSGPHYWYWPLAFYAVLNASLINRLYEVFAQRNEALLVPLFAEKTADDQPEEDRG
jgi:hypothetical protein